MGFFSLCGCDPAIPLASATEIIGTIPMNTGLPSPTKTQTPTPTFTDSENWSTTTPTPWIDLTTGYREWLPEPILIQAGTLHDLKSNPFNRDPSFVLFSNGELIQKICNAGSCQYLTTILNTQQVCRLINTIELSGFFDYDLSTYQPPLTGGEITYIEVSAWRSRQVALYQLSDWLEDPGWLDRLLDCDNCREAPEIKSALSDTYWLLDGYSIPGMTTYQPDKLALWLSEPELAGDPTDWALSTPSLSRLSAASQCSTSGQRQAVVLSGSEAERTASYINQVINQGRAPIFEENGGLYQVTTRWLLPYEEAAGCGESTNQFPSMDIPLPKVVISCRSSDGFIPTATLTPVY